MGCLRAARLVAGSCFDPVGDAPVDAESAARLVMVRSGWSKPVCRLGIESAVLLCSDCRSGSFRPTSPFPMPDLPENIQTEVRDHLEQQVRAGFADLETLAHD